MFYTLNLYNVTSQLYLSKTGVGERGQEIRCVYKNSRGKSEGRKKGGSPIKFHSALGSSHQKCNGGNGP